MNSVKQEIKPIDDAAIELPLVKCKKEDVYGMLFVHQPPTEEYKDSLLKLQTWILNFAEEQIRTLRDCEALTEEQIEAIKKKYSVISPITITLYAHWLQAEQFKRMTDSEKERYMFKKLPNRFKARLKGNAACRSAREVTPEEEAAQIAKEETQDDRRVFDMDQILEDLKSNSLPNYIKEFLGEE